jgi:hypothetical protein
MSVLFLAVLGGRLDAASIPTAFLVAALRHISANEHNSPPGSQSVKCSLASSARGLGRWQNYAPSYPWRGPNSLDPDLHSVKGMHWLDYMKENQIERQMIDGHSKNNRGRVVEKHL